MVLLRAELLGGGLRCAPLGQDVGHPNDGIRLARDEVDEELPYARHEGHERLQKACFCVAKYFSGLSHGMHP